jgi:hypothetical protein
VKVAICYFGITRSLAYTFDSIAANVLQPARHLGETRVFAHLYRQTQINNPRSKEFGALDPDEYQILMADELELEEPNECLARMRYDELLKHPDPWRDDYKSIKNLMHQLHSLERVGDLARKWSADVYVFVRPDLCYLDPLDLFLKQAIACRQPTVLYPNWQHHGGLNDRFAIVAGTTAARAYSQRGRLLHECYEIFEKNFNGERLLGYAILKAGCLTQPIYVRAQRVRFDGTYHPEGFRRPRSRLSKTKTKFWLKKVTLLIVVASSKIDRLLQTCKRGIMALLPKSWL